MKRSLLLCSAALGLAVLSTPVLAQTADQLDEVVVTATRVEAIVAEMPGARVIDERAIQQRGAVFAADILADLLQAEVQALREAGADVHAVVADLSDPASIEACAAAAVTAATSASTHIASRATVMK